MEPAVYEKRINRMIKTAVTNAIKEEIEREVKPRLEKFDEIFEILEDSILAQIAIERLAEIKGGTKTIPLSALEKKYGI